MANIDTHTFASFIKAASSVGTARATLENEKTAMEPSEIPVLCNLHSATLIFVGAFLQLGNGVE
jgi:hypothetical protein